MKKQSFHKEFPKAFLMIRKGPNDKNKLTFFEGLTAKEVYKLLNK